MIDELSITAYHEMGSKKQEQAEIVYEIVCRATHPSSSDIARLSNLPRTSVTGRLKELEEAGRIYKANTKIDPFTKKKVNWYAPTINDKGAAE